MENIPEKEDKMRRSISKVKTTLESLAGGVAGGVAGLIISKIYPVDFSEADSLIRGTYENLFQMNQNFNYAVIGATIGIATPLAYKEIKYLTRKSKK